MTPPPKKQVHALTQEMKARGERVVSLCVGEPDFQPPPAVIEATANAATEVCGGECGLFLAILGGRACFCVLPQS